MQWTTSRFVLDLSRPLVMGIVNVTPDSFSDGGQHTDPAAALCHCERLIRDGADILDIGAESTRPGAEALAPQEELSRLLPVVRAALGLGVPISVDTYKPAIMQAVLDLGVDIINDVWAMRWTDSSTTTHCDVKHVIARHPSCGVCLMHMHGVPLTMQSAPMEGDAVSQVRLFLQGVTIQAQQSGIARSRIVVDPGIGFGKTVEQNFELLARQRELLSLGLPLLTGWSRKGSLAKVAGIASLSPVAGSTHERAVASVTAALLSVQRGASIVRVHDVLETVQALRVLHAAAQRLSVEQIDQAGD